MSVLPFSPEKKISQTISSKSEGFLSIEDLVTNRHSLSVVNPWLSRWVVLCKDGHGKVGLRVSAHNKGVFVSLVVPGSPAAMAGLRFGDQVLTLGRKELAGFSTDRVHCMLRCCPVNNIVMAVRDRPLCRSVVLHKDRAGRLGFMVKEGAVSAIAINSTAARNGLLTQHQLIEVNGVCVVGLSDREIRKVIEEEGDTVTVTIMMREVFIALVRGMSEWLVKNKMNHA